MIKRCPFCKEKEIIVGGTFFDIYLSCMNCHASGPKLERPVTIEEEESVREKAIQLWNEWDERKEEMEDFDDVNYPICPMNMYFEGDENICDLNKCDYDRILRCCSESCKKEK